LLEQLQRTNTMTYYAKTNKGFRNVTWPEVVRAYETKHLGYTFVKNSKKVLDFTSTKRIINLVAAQKLMKGF